jgi:ribonuclease P protein subunit POP4
VKINPSILQKELIGLNVKVAKSPNSDLLGISGKVIDETRNTLVVRHENSDKIISKNVAVFHFTMPDRTVVEINGAVILGRPENRVKKQTRRCW